MSVKDKIVEILETHYHKGKGRLTVADVTRIAKAIADALPKLDKEKVRELTMKLLIDKYSPAGYAEKDIDEIVDQICSLVPAGEVIARGRYEGLMGGDKIKHTAVTICLKDGVITKKPKDSMFGQLGTLIWVPDKEDNG